MVAFKPAISAENNSVSIRVFRPLSAFFRVQDFPIRSVRFLCASVEMNPATDPRPQSPRLRM